MEKLRSSLAFGAVGIAGGVAGMSTTAGMCAGGACPTCLRCAGMGMVLVAVALWKKRKGVTSDGLAQSSN
ncbi:MAG: hypothetical protein IPQ16_04515 [Geobacteraceae bacterium]|nr:hypothetical protein [Geobacteraceae bacterium]